MKKMMIETATTTATSSSNGRNTTTNIIREDDTLKQAILLNNYSVGCITTTQDLQMARKVLSVVFNSIVVDSSSSSSNDNGNESSSDQYQQPRSSSMQPQQQQQHHLFDIDPLVTIPKELPSSDPAADATVEDDDSTQDTTIKMYRHPIRIPTLLAECNKNNGVLLEGVTKVAVIFNLALTYHLLATNIGSNDDDGRQQQQLLLRKAYELYQLCLKIQPQYVYTTKRVYQLVLLNNMACICHDSSMMMMGGGDEQQQTTYYQQQRNIHLNDIVSIIIYMTSRPYQKMNHPIYEMLFTPSVRLLSNNGIDLSSSLSSSSSPAEATTTNNSNNSTTIYYSAVA